MDLKRKILIVIILVIAILISSFVLIWGSKINNADTMLLSFMVIETILVVLLGIDIFTKKNK